MDTQLWLHLGLLLMGDQRADGYASAATGDPDSLQESDALLAGGDLDRALAWSSLARARDSGRGALLMARVRLSRHEPDQAAEALAVAAARISKEHPADVLAAYDTLLLAKPGEPWRHAEHAAALQSAGRSADALAAYDRAIALASDNASFHFNKGDLLFDLGRFDEAVPELLEVTRLRPDDVLGARVLLGAIAWPSDTEEAREHFTAATSSPGALLTPFTRALYRTIALAGLGRPDEAAAQLEAARSAQSADDEVPDDTTQRLLQQLQTPPLPGLDDLQQLLQPADKGNVPEDQDHGHAPDDT